jgi:hypothetical protein
VGGAGDKCARGIEALTQYRTAWDEGRKVFRATPPHDWTSHGADALRCLFTGMRKTGKAQWTDKILNFAVDWLL